MQGTEMHLKSALILSRILQFFSVEIVSWHIKISTSKSMLFTCSTLFLNEKKLLEAICSDIFNYMGVYLRNLFTYRRTLTSSRHKVASNNFSISDVVTVTLKDFTGESSLEMTGQERGWALSTSFM